MPRSFLIRKLVISTPIIKQVLYLNEDDIILPLSFWSEAKNPENFFNHYSLDSSLRSEWPTKSKDVISNLLIKQVLHLNEDDITLYQTANNNDNMICHSERSEESHNSLLPQTLRFLTSFRNDIMILHY